LRSRCNQQKHAKHPVDFMQERGFLLWEAKTLGHSHLKSRYIFAVLNGFLVRYAIRQGQVMLTISIKGSTTRLLRYARIVTKAHSMDGTDRNAFGLLWS
jgi:hypothetical protein